jgi:hypothetical protein
MSWCLTQLSGGDFMKCMFDLEKTCPVFTVQKEAGFEPHPNQILEKACLQCPIRLEKLSK